MSEADDLLRAASTLAATSDRVSARFARELARVWRDLERELGALLRDAAAGRRTPVALAVRANRLRQAIRTALTKAGYPQLVRQSGVDELIRAFVQTRRARQVAAFTGRQQSSITALRELFENDLLQLGETASRDVWRTVVQSLYSRRPVSRLLADLAETLDRTEAQTARLFDTQVSIFARQVELVTSGRDPERAFLYAGPIDERTRPFCRTHVGTVLTREQIDALDNGQLPNVLLTGGGWQCRHIWMAVSQASALRELVGTGERTPEAAADLRSLRRAA